MPTAASTVWQDLPRRARWVKARGWLCEKTLSALPGMFSIWLLTLALSIAITGGLVHFYLMPAVWTIASTGLLWIAGIAIAALGRHKIEEGCLGFLQSNQYLKDNPLGEVIGYYEVDYWLERHPHLLETVAQWALANDRTLHNRHLWAIRSQAGHKPGSGYDFLLTITPDILNRTDRIEECLTMRDVAGGALWSTMDRLELSQSSSHEQGGQTREENATRRL